MEKSNKNDIAKSSFFTDFMMGGVSAAVGKTAAAPIERIKLLMQSQKEMLKTGKLDRPYDGIVDCFRRTVSEEGVISLWQGNTANVIRYFPTQALNFAFKDHFKRMFAVPSSAPQTHKFLSNIAAGSMAGAASSVFVYSLDYARTRLANDRQKQFKGILDVYKKTWQSDGFVGLYRGFNISLVGIVVYRGLYFGLYDSLKPALSPLENNKVLLGISSFFLGWGITIGASMLSYPFDTVRRRMMMTSGEAVKYKTSAHAFAQIIKQEGVQSLFHGAGANILRAVAGASVLTAYDMLQLIAFGKAYSAGSG